MACVALVLVALGVALVGCVAEPPEAPDSELGEQSSEIIGPKTLVSPEVEPGVVAWVAPNGDWCVGTFVSDHHILTAKHCTQPAPGQIIKWTRSTDFYSQATWEEGVVARYHYDNGIAQAVWPIGSSQNTMAHDLMVIELRGRPSRDWHRLGLPIATFNSPSYGTGGSAAGYSFIGYGCQSQGGGNNGTKLRQRAVFPSAATMGIGPNAAVRKDQPNPLLWKDLYVVSYDTNAPVVFLDYSKGYLKPSNLLVCPGDSGGPLFKDGKLVGVTIGWGGIESADPWTASYFEKVPPSVSWLGDVRVENYPAPAYLSAQSWSTNVTVSSGSFDPSAEVFYDNLVNPTSTPLRLQGPIGRTNTSGQFNATFSTVGWAKGKYMFRLFTKTPGGGFRTSNEVPVYVN